MKKTVCIIVGLLVIADLTAGHSGSSSNESGKPKKIQSSEEDNTNESHKKSSSSEEQHCKPENKTIEKGYRPIQQNCALNLTGLTIDVDKILPLVTGGILKPKKHEFSIKLKTSLDVQHLCIRIWSNDTNCKGVTIKLLEIVKCNAVLHLHIVPSKLCILSCLVIEIRHVDLKALKKSNSGSPDLLIVKKLLESALNGQCSDKNRSKSSKELELPPLVKKGII